MEQTLNTMADSSPAEATPVMAGGLESTVDFIEPKSPDPNSSDENQSDDKQKQADSSSQNQQNAEGDDKGNPGDRFDQHPRFKQLVKEKNELRDTIQNLQRQMESLTKTDKSGQKPDEKREGDILGDLKNEDVLDKFNENPKQFLADLASKIRESVVTDFQQNLSQKQAEDLVVRTFKEYAEKNPDFDEMWESGEIRDFMNTNPGHNAISAHMAMTAEKRIQDAVDKAVQETKEAMTKQFMAKRNAAVLGGGPSAAAGSGIPDELKETGRFGGLHSVLAARHAARRAKAG